MVYPDLRQISVMDTPPVWIGISSDGNRHGQQLLKYLRRTRLLLLCLDATGFHAGPKKMNLFQSFLSLNKVNSLFVHFKRLMVNQFMVQELEIYQPNILKRPAVVVVNKFDAPESQFDQFEDQVLNLHGEFMKMMKPPLFYSAVLFRYLANYS